LKETFETIEGKLDIQIQEAINDITNSFKMIENLSSLHGSFNTVELIKFHKFRIKNCLKALLKVVK